MTPKIKDNRIGAYMSIPPQKWVESNLNLVHWKDIPEGGHFTAMESLYLFADDVIKIYHNFRANVKYNHYIQQTAVVQGG